MKPREFELLHATAQAHGKSGRSLVTQPAVIETNPRGDFHLIQHAHRFRLAQESFLMLYARDGGRI